jgi:HAD superfamily phosphoserine phosphatase-like hydrolase
MQSPAAIPRVSTSDILSRLEAERPGLSGALLASDADGTIWDGDVGIDLFEAVIASRGVREAAREALAAEARSLGVPAEGDANALTVALYDAFKADRYPHDRAFAMMAWVFAGHRRDELAAFCDRVLAEGRIASRIRPELRAIFAWAASRGVEVYVVSASADVMVERAVKHLGIAADHVVAMTPALSADGVLLPELAGPIVYGEGKLAALDRARAGARASLLGAFGDSTYDAAMLRAARVPVAVTPAPGLVALAPTIAGLVMLDR